MHNITGYPQIVLPHSCAGCCGHVTVSLQTPAALLQPDTLNHGSIYSLSLCPLPFLSRRSSSSPSPSSPPHYQADLNPPSPVPGTQASLCQHLAQSQPVSHTTPQRMNESLRLRTLRKPLIAHISSDHHFS